MTFITAHLLEIFSLVFGAVVGSFLNVCIYRIPAEHSIVLPASHCPNCSHPIAFYDNIPIISYLFLRGRCRHCKTVISPVYPLVESLTALLSLFLLLRFGPSLQYLFAFAFTCSLIVITFIDLEHQIIPDIISLPGIPLFSLAAVLFMDISLRDSLIGIVAGGGILYLVATGYQLFKKIEGMGGGDIKLLAMMGGFLGWQSLLFVVLVSSLLGAVVGITVIIARKGDMKYAIPFGPFLSIGAVAYLFWGDRFLQFLIR